MIHALAIDKRGNCIPIKFHSEAELDNWLATQRRTRSGVSIGAAMRDNRPSLEVLEQRARQNEVIIRGTSLGIGWRLHGEDSYHLCSSRAQCLRNAFDNGQLGD